MITLRNLVIPAVMFASSLGHAAEQAFFLDFDPSAIPLSQLPKGTRLIVKSDLYLTPKDGGAESFTNFGKGFEEIPNPYLHRGPICQLVVQNLLLAPIKTRLRAGSTLSLASVFNYDSWGGFAKDYKVVTLHFEYGNPATELHCAWIGMTTLELTLEGFKAITMNAFDVVYPIND